MPVAGSVRTRNEKYWRPVNDERRAQRPRGRSHGPFGGASGPPDAWLCPGLTRTWMVWFGVADPQSLATYGSIFR